MLIRKGADVNLETNLGEVKIIYYFCTHIQTALHLATCRKDPDVVECLLNAGAKVDAQKYVSFETPLHMAARGCCLLLVRMLIDGGAQVNATTTEGYVNRIGNNFLNTTDCTTPTCNFLWLS